MVESREAFLIKEPKDTNSVAEWFLDQIEIAEDELFASGKKFASSKKFAKTHLDSKSILKMLLLIRPFFHHRIQYLNQWGCLFKSI